jgi:hypothetical protein
MASLVKHRSMESCSFVGMFQEGGMIIIEWHQIVSQQTFGGITVCSHDHNHAQRDLMIYLFDYPQPKSS